MSRYKNPQYQLRMSPELKEQIQARADKACRSLHSEIIFRLEKSIEGEVNIEELTEADVYEQIKQINAHIRSLTDTLDKLVKQASLRK